MQLFAGADSNILGLIQHLEELRKEALELSCITSDLHDVNTRIDAINRLIDFIKKNDPTIQLTLREIIFFEKYCNTITNILTVQRNELINTIDKRRNTEVQMNINGEMYDEQNLITRFSVSLNNEECPNNVSQINMEELREPKDYSILSIINQFESEETLLTDIKAVTAALCYQVKEGFCELNERFSEIKNTCNDIEFINRLCDNESDNEIIMGMKHDLSFYDFVTNKYTDQIMKLFQIYQELLQV